LNKSSGDPKVEQDVLSAVFHLHPDAYGVSVRNVIETYTQRRYSFGTIYAALERLELGGFVISREGEPEKKRGGRRKLFFTISGEGKKALDSSLNALVSLGRGALGLV
jgi:PadR family transcriptional regulator, regulatory protein PadR